MINNEKSAYLPALDGLRALACLLVVLCHSVEIRLVPYLPFAGIIGVKLFFVLSGFLMAHLYFPGEASGRYWRSFLLRRFFRIYPAYAMAMVALWICFELGMPIPLFWDFGIDRLITQLLLHDYIMTYWSNVHEMQFYAVFPLLCAPFLLFPGSRRYWPLALGLLWLLLLVIVHDTFTNMSLWEKLPCFIGGMAAAAWLPFLRFRLGARVGAWMLWACLGMMALVIVPGIGVPREESLLTALCVLAVSSCALVSGRSAAVLSHRSLRFIAGISYSLYVTHRITFGLTAYLPVFNMWVAAADFVLAFIVAWVSYRLVEAPCIRLGRRLTAAGATK